MADEVQPKEFAVVIIGDGQGRVLFGKRRDNKKWTLAAGGINPGEKPEDGALREVFEETGLKPKALSFIDSRKGEKGIIHFFSCQCPGEPTTDNDPDNECSKLVWVDVRDGIPSNVWNKLQGPADDTNIVRQVYDLKKSESVWLEECGFMDLRKSEETASEVATLLKHPNPTERALSLKLKSVTPHDLSVAILDPDPKVWGAAFDHKDASHAHSILASNTRDASGKTLWERHNLLIKSPNFNKDHLSSMAHAVKRDAHLHPKEQADRLRFLALNGYSDLQKRSEWAHHLLYAGSTQGVDVAKPDTEETHESLKPLKSEYEASLASKEAIEPHNAGLHDIGQMSPKVVYHVGDHKLMVKPYGEEDHPLAGWGEATSQALYHSAGLGHLHQKSFVSNHGGGKYNIPATVIKLDTEATPIHKASLGQLREQNPAIDDEARKMSILDFLTTNRDRHHNNLMVQKNGHLLAVDNTDTFGTSDKSFHHYNSGGYGVVLGDKRSNSPEGAAHYQNVLKDWWPTVSTDLKSAFDKRLSGISSMGHRERIKNAFNEKAAWLDRKAEEAKSGNGNLDDFTVGSTLQKKMEESEFLSNHADMKMPGLHEKLMDKHPASMQPEVEHFENNVNNSTAPSKPLKHSLGGLDAKAVYGHADKKYLVKPSVFRVSDDDSDFMGQLSTPLSAWNELTSQAMYHAGNIGHLHQKVHATVAKNVFPDAHGMVVHLEPGAREAAELNPEEKKNLVNHPDLKKIAFMDFVTFNKDRHDSNLMVKKDGTPLAIDHSLAFRHDINPDFSLENQDLEWGGVGTGVKRLGGDLRPDANTWAWWHANKDNIKNAFHKHADLVPHKDTRERLKDSFNYRMDLLDDGATPLGQPIQNGLYKTLEGSDFLHTQHDQPTLVKPMNMSGIHEKLKMATPNPVKMHRQRFELGLNQHPDKIKPVMSYDPSVQRTDLGEEPKSIYHVGGSDKVMIKPQAAPTTKLSAWNEMTSQAMYHAGGIGHLHQKVHATTLANQGNKAQPGKDPHAIAVHMAPNVRTVTDAVADENDPRMEKLAGSEQHLQSLKKMGVMDWLTSNEDRHEGNIMVAPDGSPLAIDHGRAFSNDRLHAFGIENDIDAEAQGKIRLAQALGHPDMPKATKHILENAQGQKERGPEINKDPHKQLDAFDNFNGCGGGDFYSDATKIGGPPDKETWKWFDENKHKMHDAYKKHVAMLPDEESRSRMLSSFNTRLQHLNQVRQNSNNLETEGFKEHFDRTIPDKNFGVHPTEAKRRVG